MNIINKDLTMLSYFVWLITYVGGILYVAAAFTGYKEKLIKTTYHIWLLVVFICVIVEVICSQI